MRTHFIASKSTWNLSSAILKSKVQLIHFCSHHGHPYPPSKFKTSNPFFLCHTYTHIQLQYTYTVYSYTFVYNSPCFLLSQIFLDSSVPVITSTSLQIPPLCLKPSHKCSFTFFCSWNQLSLDNTLSLKPVYYFSLMVSEAMSPFSSLSLLLLQIFLILSYSKLFSVSQSPPVHFVDLWTPLVSCISNWPISTQNTQMFLKEFVIENWISNYKYISLTIWILWPELLVLKNPFLNNVIN